METMLVRLKEYNPRRGQVLRRFVYDGVKFQVECGWYRVSKEMAEYLKTVRQEQEDPNSPLAFEVCSEAEAKALDAKIEQEAKVRREADEAIERSVGRGESAVTTADLPEEDKSGAGAKKGRKG